MSSAEVPKTTANPTTNLSLPENQNVASSHTPGEQKTRFGGKSYNMFFIRHTAQPRNLRIFTGY